MSKREYIIANRKWLEDKAKEEGVNALPNGIYYKVLKVGNPNGANPRDGASSPFTTPAGPSTAGSSTAVGVARQLPCD